jgi:flavin reductase (DIM6/NTAB) family NADH-FMN oxidoreductase RutF
MSKLQWKPTTILNPVPVVMATCADEKGKPNIITLAWTGTINSEPPMVSISVRPERYSHGLILNSRQFVINLVTRTLVRAADLCGVKSGRNTDKFKATGLTPVPASIVKVPMIDESPVNIECEVNVDKRLADAKGRLRLDRAGLICYNHGEYFGLGRAMGYFGYSVRRKKKLKRSKK